MCYNINPPIICSVFFPHFHNLAGILFCNSSVHHCFAAHQYIFQAVTGIRGRSGSLEYSKSAILLVGNLTVVMMINVMSWRLPHLSVFCDCDARLIVYECRYACFHTLTQCLLKACKTGSVQRLSTAGWQTFCEVINGCCCRYFWAKSLQGFSPKLQFFT